MGNARRFSSRVNSSIPTHTWAMGATGPLAASAPSAKKMSSQIKRLGRIDSTKSDNSKQERGRSSVANVGHY